jgi:hypothetical protein
MIRERKQLSYINFNVRKIMSKKGLGQSGIAHDALAIGIVVVLVISSIGFYVSSRAKNRAHAISGNQWCVESTVLGQACLNAWNGGPFVRVYIHRGQPNNYFDLRNNSGDIYNLRATGTSNTRWNNQCIGDAYNNRDLASIKYQTSLDSCGVGWGTNFTVEICSNGVAFKNVHSGKYLAPGDFGNGAPFVLNGTKSAGCFDEF